ncbi:hypothetical protein GCM10023310_19130 [Paenibacillus vulneris]
MDLFILSSSFGFSMTAQKFSFSYSLTYSQYYTKLRAYKEEFYEFRKGTAMVNI